MKKIICVLISFYFFNIKYIFATTIGHSIGMNIGLNELSTKEKINTTKKEENKNINYGIFYKYNWNVNKFLIGIELFYDTINQKTTINNDFVKLTYRYGSDINIGYDITDNFYLYGIVGYGFMRYKMYNNTYNYRINNTTSKILYGFGLGYNLFNNWRIGLEYKYQNLNKIIKGTNYYFNNKVSNINFLISYKF